MLLRLLLALLFAAAAWGQNTARFPANLPNHADLLVAANNAETALSSSISDTTLTIPVVDATGFFIPGANEAGALTIGTEHIKYCSISSNTITVCAGGRGFDGSLATSHLSGAAVRGTAIAHHHNQMAAEIVAITSQLGANLANVASSTHAATHSQGGSDAVTVENLGTACAAGEVPESDGLGGLICGAGGGAVSSVFGRTGDVVAQANDYTWAQIDKTTSDLADITTRSHASLQNLAADDHAQYGLLAGRTGGQTFIGGTGAGDDLTLQTTSDVTKGSYIFSEMTSAGVLKNSGAGVVTGGNLVADADLANNYSGVGSCAANQFANVLNDNAAPGCAQPAFSDLSGTATKAQLPAAIAYEDEANIFTVAGGVTLDNELALRLREATANGANFFALKAPAALAADFTWTTPNALPGSTLCLEVTNTGQIQYAADACGTGSGGDSIQVNGAAATDANFITRAATGTLPSVTPSLNTTPSPDEITFDIGAASATEAGVVTTGAQSFAGAKTLTGVLTLNPGTTPAQALLLDITQPGVAGTRDSHFLDLRGTSFDTGGHNADWRAFVDVTSDAGASTLTLQSRIDAAAFANRMTLSDAGLLTVTDASISSLTNTRIPFTSAGVLTDDAGLTFASSRLTAPALTVDTDTLFVDAVNNRVGIGTASPSQPFYFEHAQGDVYFKDLSAVSAFIDTGIILNGNSTIQSGLFTSVNGEIMNLGINEGNFTSTPDVGRVGGVIRIDTRNSEQYFAVFGAANADAVGSNDNLLRVDLGTGDVSAGHKRGALRAGNSKSTTSFTGTFLCYNETVTTGVSQCVARAGAGQGSTPISKWLDNGGSNTLFEIGATGIPKKTSASLGATSTDGLILENPTAAAVGAQQISPRLRLTGQGWKTDATAASQTVDWALENLPVEGAAAPSTHLLFKSQVNAGGYTNRAVFKSDGTLQLPGYDCTVNANGGALTTDASGNLICSDDDTGAGGGDAISVNGTAATDANFINTAASGTVPSITWNLNTTPSPDEINISAIGAASATEAGILTTGAQTIAGNKTFSGTVEAGTLTEGGNAVPNATDHLGFFAATTSAQLAGVLSDETGTGAAVFASSPTLTTPTIGDFTNAAHNHQNAAGGGTLAKAALPSAIAYEDEANIFTLANTFRRNSLGTTSTDGAILENTTAAAAGAQQISPRLRLTGQGWKTDATAASQTVDWVLENLPVQGAANPSSDLRLQFQVAGGGYTNKFTFRSNGFAANTDAAFGINQSAPAEAHHVSRSGALQSVASLYTNATTGHTVSDGFYVGYSDHAYLWNYENTDLVFATNNAQQMKIGTAWDIKATAAPASGTRPLEFFTTNSDRTGATNEGQRVSLMAMYCNETAVEDAACLAIDNIQRTSTGQINRTGIHVKSYTEPDNGGEVSAILGVSTGGGPAITAYKVSSLRPAGWTDHSSSAQPALEVGTADQSAAGLFIAGSHSSSNTSQSVWARIDNTTSKGILVQPNDGTFDTRKAFQVGTHTVGGANTNIKWEVELNGDQKMIGALTYDERSTTPSNPTSGTQARVYMKADKLVIQYNDAGTVRYKFLDLTSTGVTWQHSTTAP